MPRYTSLFGLAVLLLGACATTDVTETADGGYYPVGYSDGCASAGEAGKAFSSKTIRDKTLFETYSSYRSGWRQGYQACGRTSPRVHESTDPYSDDRIRDF